MGRPVMADYGGTDNTSGAELTGGGKGGSRGGPMPDIGATSDQDVAPAVFEAPMADGEPVSPRLAATRYGAAAGQGGHGNGDPGSP